MPREKHHSPNWGGRRPGAGKPRTLGETTTMLSFRIDTDTAGRVKDLGGSAFMRNAVKDAIRREDAHPSQQALRDIPGYHGVTLQGLAGVRFDPDDAVPMADLRVDCGLPAPALDTLTEFVSLKDMIVRNRKTTFMVTATGDSMVDAGIYEGDTVILDRGIEAKSGDIVLAYLHGDLTLKRLRFEDGKPVLHPENEAANYPVIRPMATDDFQIQGVLTGIYRKYR